MSRSGRFISPVILAAVVLALAAVPAAASGITVYESEDGVRKVVIGGRVQLQYHNEAPDDGHATDDLFFRRLRPYISGTVTKNWMGKIQFDLGKAEGGNEVAIKDAYAMWSGLKNHKFYIGNTKTPYSREFLTSSKELQIIERSFAGSHDYGSPDRQLGLRVDGHSSSKKITWAASLGSESHDPSSRKLDFDTPVNRNDDFNEGWGGAARIDWHPLGYASFNRTDFQSDKIRFNVSLAAYAWGNDDDNNTYTDPNRTSAADLDNAQGVEISAGIRGLGISGDVEYQKVLGETVLEGFTGGIYDDGEADLDIVSAQAGYYLPVAPVEFVVGWDRLGADPYEASWSRLSGGVNWFWNEQKAKIQAIFRKNQNVDGVDGADMDEIIVQTQFLFE